MEWTRTTPTEPGYYWLIENGFDGDAHIVDLESEISYDDDGKPYRTGRLILWGMGNECDFPVPPSPALWYGPLQPPDASFWRKP